MAGYNRNTEAWCSCCDKPKEKTSFMVSLNPDHHKFLPYCKACLNAKIKNYREATGSDGAALWCLCGELGYPMLKEAYDITMKLVNDKGTKNTNLFNIYHGVLKYIGFVVQGFWQSDMELSDFIQTKKNRSFEEEKKPVDYVELNRKWGKFEADEYDLLEEFFEMYTQDLPNMDTAMELRYRDLCKAELRKRKADESGDIGEITKAEESLRKNMALLKLDKFQDNKQSEIEKHIERMCWMVENTRPCECRDLEKYKDFSGFGIKWEEIMRCVRNLVAGTREYPDIPRGED